MGHLQSLRRLGRYVESRGAGIAFRGSNYTPNRVQVRSHMGHLDGRHVGSAVQARCWSNIGTLWIGPFRPSVGPSVLLSRTAVVPYSSFQMGPISLERERERMCCINTSRYEDLFTLPNTLLIIKRTRQLYKKVIQSRSERRDCH